MGTTDRRTARFSTPAPITHSHTGTTRARRPTIPSMAAVESTTAPARASSTAAEGGHSSTHNTHKPAQFTQLAAPTGAGGDGPGPSTVGCLPKAARFLSPRTYFAALTPRTKVCVYVVCEERYVRQGWRRRRPGIQYNTHTHMHALPPALNVYQYTSHTHVHLHTTRTQQASLGDDDYTEQLRALREKFPESADADMVPFIRVCKVWMGGCFEWRG